MKLKNIHTYIRTFNDNLVGLRHVSFKLSAKEGIMNATRMNFQREK